MTLPPDAPWHLTGECVIAAVPGARPGPLPPGICRLPGPAVLVAVAYDTSPVGPYLELAVAEPARAGLRPGLCVTTMVVSSAESRVAGVVNWGFPKELGTLAWLPTGDGVEVCWNERGVVVRAASRARWSVPSAVVLPILQRRSDGSVTVRARVHGRARPARVSVAVPQSR
ncbi:MAG: hypothetical protein C4344_05415 [Acidimicrobiia bacterium]